MWPVVLTISGFLAFVLLSGIGLIWLSLQVFNGAWIIKSPDTPKSRIPPLYLSAREGRGTHRREQTDPHQPPERCGD